MLWLTALILIAGAADPDDGWKPLVHGTDPAQFELVGLDADALRILDGEIVLTGKVDGYFATRDAYQDFALEFEFRYERPDNSAADVDPPTNSGLLVNIRGPAKVWPRCIEFQLAQQAIGEIRGNGGGRLPGDYDRASARRAARPLDQWNRMELVSWRGTLTCTLNGVEVSKGTRPDPDRGALGFQSEGSPIRFRGVRIKTLD